MSAFFRNLAGGATLGLLLSGCGTAPSADYSRIERVRAQGTIRLDGHPLPDAVVTFEAPDGQFSYGMTDSRGYYALQLDSVASGVTPGKKIVRISTSRKILGLNTENGEGEGEGGESPPAAAPETVPEKYNTKSVLATDVVSTRTDYSFDLASK